MNDDYMYDYCDDCEPEMGPWQTFFFITFLAIVFILLWPIALVLMIYAYLSEKRWNAKMEEESLNTERRHEYYDEMDDEKKNTKRKKSSNKKKSKARRKK